MTPEPPKPHLQRKHPDTSRHVLLQGQFELPACEAGVSEFPIQASELRRSSFLLQQEKLSQRGKKPRIAFKKNQRRHPKTKHSAHVTGKCPVVMKALALNGVSSILLEGSH